MIKIQWLESRRCSCLVTWFCYHFDSKTRSQDSHTSMNWPISYLSYFHAFIYIYMYQSYIMIHNLFVITGHHTSVCQLLQWGLAAHGNVCERSYPEFSYSLLWRHNGAMASQITSLVIVYSTVNWGADQRKHQRSASLAFVRGIHRPPVNSPHKWLVTRKIFPFEDVIMGLSLFVAQLSPEPMSIYFSVGQLWTFCEM